VLPRGDPELRHVRHADLHRELHVERMPLSGSEPRVLRRQRRLLRQQVLRVQHLRHAVDVHPRMRSLALTVGGATEPGARRGLNPPVLSARPRRLAAREPGVARRARRRG
jgi:hypothetical protein